ncbi:hypothetical protein [Pseudodesulfovibrio methanolicus]|uniref:Uncharacterized protein n=1 Tax=Pseudodesulfovibrio methanolicus TaxID=3126690 RepID=A0ABZ2IZK3_9BACT
MAIDYFYSWDSFIGIFEIHHRDDDYWELHLGEDHLATTGSPQSCVTMLRHGEIEVNWGDEGPDAVPPLSEWAEVDY